MEFQGKVAVITGAGRGIGKALSAAYARRGAHVIVAEMNEAEGAKQAEAIRREGGSALFVKTDVRKEEEIVRLMQIAAEQFGTVDILVNNAGVSRWKPVFELGADEWDDVINTNLRGAFLCAREAAKLMRNHGRGGSIVNIASTRAIMSEPNSEAYAASKGGIVSLTHALAASLGPDRIRVNCISPGWIETGDYGALREIDHSQHPAGRVGRPEDIVRACFYFTDPDNDFVTGAHLVVDGGMTRKMIYEP
jgi:NAD(P)-dependent dehydrogenase (short-subunit alcohol dehydrogenase family)